MFSRRCSRLVPVARTRVGLVLVARPSSPAAAQAKEKIS